MRTYEIIFLLLILHHAEANDDPEPTHNNSEYQELQKDKISVFTTGEAYNHITERFVTDGDAFSLTCEAKNSAMQIIGWARFDIIEQSVGSPVRSEAVYKVSTIGPSDGGYYVCLCQLEDKKFRSVPISPNVINSKTLIVKNTTVSTSLEYNANPHREALLKCTVALDSNEIPVVWQFRKYDSNTSAAIIESESYVFEDNGQVLRVKDISIDDIGFYTCNIDLSKLKNEYIVGKVESETVDVSKTIELILVPFVQALDASIDVSLEDTTTIECISIAYPFDNVSIKWLFSANGSDFKALSDSERFEVRQINDSTRLHSYLSIRNIQKSDRGAYNCSSSNPYATHSSVAFLRVLDPLRVVWPLIVIVVEIVVFALILLIHEFRKAKRNGSKVSRLDSEVDMQSDNNNAK